MWMLPQNRQEKYLKTIKVLMTASAFSARSMLPAHYIKLAITKGTPEIVSFMIKFHPTLAKRFAQYTMSAIREGDHVMVHGDETNPVNIKWNTTRRAILDAVIQGIPGFLARQSPGTPPNPRALPLVPACPQASPRLSQRISRSQCTSMMGVCGVEGFVNGGVRNGVSEYDSLKSLSAAASYQRRGFCMRWRN